MRKISYKERANFYDYEITKEKNIIEDLQTYKEKINIKKIVYCPCGSGIYLEEISSLYDESLLFDLEENMIKYLNKKIKEKNIKNVKTKILNMLNIDDVKDNYDCIFVFNQGIQYLTLDEFNIFLKKSSKVSEYIILDLFDFSKKGKISYYDSNIKDNILYISKTFNIDKVIIERKNKHFHQEDGIKFEYYYYTDKILNKKTSFKLYYYSTENIEKIINNNNKYKIVELKENAEKGRYTVVLKRRKYGF